MTQFIAKICTAVAAVFIVTGCASTRKPQTAPQPAMAETVADNLSPNDRQRFNRFFLEAVNRQQKGEYAAAYDLLRHCNTLDPNAAEVYFLLSHYHSVLQMDSVAVEDMYKAAALRPQNDAYVEQLGLSLLQMSRYKEAIDTYEKLWAMDKKRSDALELLVQLYRKVDDKERLLDVLNRMETAEGSSENITIEKMYLYSQQGKKKEEFRELKALADKNPYDLNYKVMMGNWLLQNKREQEALEQYKDVLKAEPKNIMARVAMVDYYREKEMFNLSDSLMEEIVVDRSTPEENRLMLMQQYIRNQEGRNTDSIHVLQIFDRAIAVSQSVTDMGTMKAVYMMLKGMDNDSITAVYAMILDKEPDNAFARLRVLQAKAQAEDYDEVGRLAREGTEYNPDEMVFYYFLGVTCFQKGDMEGALDAYKRGVSQINEESDKNLTSDLYGNMGYLLYEKNMKKEAFAAFDSCLHWNEENIECLNNYAYYLSLEELNLEKAERMSRKTIEADSANSSYLDTYAWILFKMGRYQEAEEYIVKAVENEEEASAGILEHAGDIFANLGQTERAMEYWQRSLTLNGANDLLRKKIKQKKYLKQ
ncbi:MAG: tetratricopeptide repeat protein [Prevotella sp.]|nr:tetratricopeptide repeat protein [Prevotella sp.]